MAILGRRKWTPGGGGVGEKTLFKNHCSKLYSHRIGVKAMSKSAKEGALEVREFEMGRVLSISTCASGIERHYAGTAIVKTYRSHSDSFTCQ